MLQWTNRVKLLRHEVSWLALQELNSQIYIISVPLLKLRLLVLETMPQRQPYDLHFQSWVLKSWPSLLQTTYWWSWAPWPGHSSPSRTCPLFGATCPRGPDWPSAAFCALRTACNEQKIVLSATSKLKQHVVPVILVLPDSDLLHHGNDFTVRVLVSLCEEICLHFDNMVLLLVKALL